MLVVGRKFISFDDIINDGVPEGVDVIINAGMVLHLAVVRFEERNINYTYSWIVYNGGGFVGVGEPTAVHHQGRF